MTPSNDNFYMPAEYTPHDQCWMLWPTRSDVWRENAAPAQEAFARVATAISQFEPVTVGALPELVTQARQRLPLQVRVVEMVYDDAWARDTGPTFVVNDKGGLAGVDWAFNAWGGREEGAYFPWDKDEQVARQIVELVGAERLICDMILEGGSIHVDGEGTLLTTAECLLNPNRNPDLTQTKIEQTLREYLGVRHIIWLPRGLYLDETYGHVDNIACFARPGEVILAWTDDQTDPQYDISHEAYEVLAGAKDVHGRVLTIHKLHQPTPMHITPEEAAGIQVNAEAKHRHEARRMGGSYVNFYLPNGGVVMPAFGDEKYDQLAQQTLAQIFPERKIVPIYSREILLGGGNIHCITQQQPRRLTP